MPRKSDPCPSVHIGSQGTFDAMEAIQQGMSASMPTTRPARALVRLCSGLPAVALAGWIALGVMVSSPAFAAACMSANATFGFTGSEQCYAVPAGVSSLHIVAVGAAGGSAPSAPAGSPLGGAGGAGALITSNLRVTPGEVIFVEVGGAGGAGGVCLVGSSSCTGSSGTGAGGFNGGSPGGFTAAPASEVANLFAGGGGGATDVRTIAMGTGACAGGSAAGSAASLSSRLLVAGGGGGGGNAGIGNGENGGHGGSSSQVSSSGASGGSSGGADGKGGGAGRSSAGGAGGAPGAGTTNGVGGGAGSIACAGGGGNGTSANSGGGGGGGRYGGGGGGGGATVLSATPPLVTEGAGGGGGAGSAFVTAGSMCGSSIGSASGQPAQVIIIASNPCGATPAATPTSGVKGTPPQPPGSTGADTSTMAGGAFLLVSGALMAYGVARYGRRESYPSSTSQK